MNIWHNLLDWLSCRKKQRKIRKVHKKEKRKNWILIYIIAFVVDVVQVKKNQSIFPIECVFNVNTYIFFHPYTLSKKIGMFLLTNTHTKSRRQEYGWCEIQLNRFFFPDIVCFFLQDVPAAVTIVTFYLGIGVQMLNWFENKFRFRWRVVRDEMRHK